MSALRHEAKIVDLQEYRRRRGAAEAAAIAVPPAIGVPVFWAFAWVPVVLIYPVWRVA